MKKLAFVMALMLCISALFGCSATVVDVDDEAVATDTKDNVPVTKEQTTDEITDEIVPEPISDITIEDSVFTDKTEFDSGAVAEISITAPKIIAEQYGENVDRLNELFDINIDTVKNEYLYDVALGEGAEGANSSSRTLSYELYSAKDGIVSVLLEIVSQSGSTNPARSYKAINFDLNEGKVITMADVISADKIDAVKANILEQMRTEPNKYYSTDDTALDNVDFTYSFLLKDEYIYIYFEEYVIAPRVEGMQIFEIDINEIA